MPPSLENPQPLSPEQFRQMLAEALADPNLARRVLMPLTGTVFPIQGGVPATVLTVQDDGKVGIGTATPVALLHVEKNQNASTAIVLSNPNTQSSALTQLQLTTNSGLSQSVNHYLFGPGWTGDSLPGVPNANLALTKFESGVGDVLYRHAGTKSFNWSTYYGTEAIRLTLTAVGNLGIGTTTPAAKLDVRPEAADRIGVAVQAFTGQTASLQQWKDSGGTVKACIDEGGRLVFNSIDTKQSTGGGGPELISAQGSDQDKVVLWSGLTTDTEGRFLFSYRGFLEWGAGGTNDQDVALFRNGPGGISIQNFFSSGSGTTSTEAFRVNMPVAAGGNEGQELFAVDTTNKAVRVARGESGFSGSESFRVARAQMTTTSSAATLATISLSDSRAYYITARVVGRRSDASEFVHFFREALVTKQGGAVTIVGGDAVDIGGTPIRSGAADWSCPFSVDGSNNLAIQVRTPTQTITVYWVATIEYQSVSTDA
ncbi:MAG: hypothetical protein A3J28_14935 [Acidobacteria bacterium RIFCSPLOWO2_12_FULL_60_22]|nr:MAG: hypothetical protein A3J28_14935 [Acidobacteria bacterium RIFCSPLOWO2_12_FULL_60_22]